METRTALTERNGWKAALQTGDIAYAASSAPYAAAARDQTVIIAVAGTSATRTAGLVNLLEVRYGWSPLPENSLLLTDTRDLPSFDNRVPRSAFVPCGLDLDPYLAWQAHPESFREQQGAVHSNGWLPAVDSGGARLISASANVTGYQASDLFEEGFVSRKAHLLSAASGGSGGGGPRDIAVATVEFPGGTGTGVSPHLLAAARRACADDGTVTLHSLRFLVLPTETAEAAVRVNAQQAIIEVALQSGLPGGAQSSGTVISVSPYGPERIIDSAVLEERTAHLVWTITSRSTGLLAPLLAELANVEALTTRDQRGLSRSLAFAGVGVVDAGLFEVSQELTLELLVRIGSHLYGREASTAVIDDDTADGFAFGDDDDGRRELVVTGPAAGGSPVFPSGDGLPEPRSRRAPSPAARRQSKARPGERARELARELAAVPMIGVEWSQYAATGMTQAEERRLRRDYVDALEQEYHADVRTRLRSVLPDYAGPYRDAFVDALNSGGVPAALYELARSERVLEAEIAALPQPRIKVSADRLEQREKELYRGRSLRARMKLLQEFLDGASRTVRYRAVLLALRAIRSELRRLAERLRRRTVEGGPLIAKAGAMMLTIRRSRRDRSDPHVVSVLDDEAGEHRVRETLAGDLLETESHELIKRLWSEDGNGVARRIEEQSPAQVLADLAARVSGELSRRQQRISIGDIILDAYDDGPERLRSALRGALTRSLETGDYARERNGRTVRRLVFTAHRGSDRVQQVIRESLNELGHLSELSERPASSTSPAIHFLTIEAGVSPACLIPACKGGSWYQSWVERQRAFESGLATNPAARDSLVLEATRRHRTLQRLDAAYVETTGAGRTRAPTKAKGRRLRSGSRVVD